MLENMTQKERERFCLYRIYYEILSSGKQASKEDVQEILNDFEKVLKSCHQENRAYKLLMGFKDAVVSQDINEQKRWLEANFDFLFRAGFAKPTKNESCNSWAYSNLVFHEKNEPDRQTTLS